MNQDGVAVDERWNSGIPYDPTAIEWLIDDKYLAFIRYNTDDLVDSGPASANGNVITFHPDLMPDKNPRAEVVNTLKEHEAQHVIQHYELHDLDIEYAKKALKYEKEACARQIIKGTVTAEVEASILDNLEKYGMPRRQAKSWIDEVFKSMSYPGVTSPRT